MRFFFDGIEIAEEEAVRIEEEGLGHVVRGSSGWPRREFGVPRGDVMGWMEMGLGPHRDWTPGWKTSDGMQS